MPPADIYKNDNSYQPPVKKIWGPIILITFAIFISGFAAFSDFVFGTSQSVFFGENVAAMAPSSALCFLLLGFCLLTMRQTDWRPFNGAGACSKLGLIVIAGIAVANLALMSSGRVSGLDGLLFPKEFDALGIMSPATSICFLIAAAGSAAVAHRGFDAGVGELTAVIAASVGLACAAIGFVAHLFVWQRIESIALYSAMAPHTAFAFGAVFLGMLLQRPKVAWVAVFSGPGHSRKIARSLLPVALIAPTFTCYITFQFLLPDASPDGFAMSIPSVGATIILVVAIVLVARVGILQEERLAATMSELRGTVADRDLLLRELNHRVKNNLQQVSAILALEQIYIKDDEARATLERVNERLLAIAAAHQLLIGGDRAAEVDAPAFLSDLIETFQQGLLANDRISIKMEPSDTDLIDIDMAMTIGLIVSELLTNAIKHAFPDNRSGKILVGYFSDNTHRRISVSDDGSGVAVSTGDGFGGLIMEGLLGQIGGELKYAHENGTAAVVAMPK